MSTSDSKTEGSSQHPFAATRWSVVLAASGNSDSQAQRALAELCENYWYPLYAYVRRSGQTPDDALDVTQAFFTRLIEKNFLEQADPQRGRFRTFLLAALKHFMINEWSRARAAKRGGTCSVFSIDVHDAEKRYGIEPADDRTPEKLFERQWALSVVNRALAQLRLEYAESGKAELFESIKDVMYGHSNADYASIAEKLNMSVSAVGVAFHRLRRRCRDILREHIAETVATPSEISDEINELLNCL